MYITDLSKVEKTIPKMEGAKDIFKQVPLSKNNGAPAFSFRVFTIKPGGNTPFHEHPFEHMNYIIKGKGILVMKDAEHPVKEGDFALVLPNEKHQYKNASANEDFVMICAVPREYE
jgi:quercetin dioxygenase-like cupin family protein